MMLYGTASGGGGDMYSSHTKADLSWCLLLGWYALIQAYRRSPSWLYQHTNSYIPIGIYI